MNKPLPEFANKHVKVLLLNVIIVIETDLYYMHKNVIKSCLLTSCGFQLMWHSSMRLGGTFR